MYSKVPGRLDWRGSEKSNYRGCFVVFPEGVSPWNVEECGTFELELD